MPTRIVAVTLMGALYVLEDDVYVHRDAGRVIVSRRMAGKREVLLERPLVHVSELVLIGTAVVTPQALRALAEQGSSVHYITRGGTHCLQLAPLISKNVPARVAQFRAHLDPARKLRIAQDVVVGKLKNAAVFMRRGGQGTASFLDESVRMALRTTDENSLRGVEGNAASAYFGELSARMPEGFTFQVRSKRPPRDPTNSLLSFAYTMLAKEALNACVIAGLDPYVGYLHEIKYGKPSLALDLMEEFRSIIADSVCLTLLNKNMLNQNDFTNERGYPTLTKEAFPTFLRAWEERLNTRVQHPLLGQKLEYRAVMVAQARLLVKHLLGELETYKPFAAR